MTTMNNLCKNIHNLKWSSDMRE